MSGWGEDEEERTHIARSGRAPTPAFCESLDLLACGLERVGTALLPDVDATGAEGKALLVCETVDDHWEDAEGDGVEDDLRIADVAYAEVCDGGGLTGHWAGEEGWGVEVAGEGGIYETGHSSGRDEDL